MLAETTTLPFGEIAFAAGFASIRQFNATVREVFAMTPTQLREARGPPDGVRGRGGWGQRCCWRDRGAWRGPRIWPETSAPGAGGLRLAYRHPIDLERMFGILAARALEGVESVEGGCYRRTLQLPNGTGIVSLGPGGTWIRYWFWLRFSAPVMWSVELQLEDLRDLTAAVQLIAGGCSTWTPTPRR